MNNQRFVVPSGGIAGLFIAIFLLFGSAAYGLASRYGRTVDVLANGHAHLALGTEKEFYKLISSCQ